MTYTQALCVALLGLASIAADGCSPAPPKPLPGGTDARAACARGAALGCPALGPTPAGVPCESWLGAAPVSSAYVACVAGAESCAAVDGCAR